MKDSRRLRTVINRRATDNPTLMSQRYATVRAATEALAAPLSAEDCAIQSMPDASPIKWHLAHTSWFFETFILEAHVAGYRSFRPAFRVLFNSYYNAVGEKHPRAQRGLLSRPSRDEVLAYRTHVDAEMAGFLESDRAEGGDAVALVELGLNHEEQHQELILTDLLHMLSCNPLAPAYVSDATDFRPGTVLPLKWVEFEAGLVEVGHDGKGFAFDNETPRHRQYLERFALASRPVTNGEYLGFIADGGYRRPELWLSEGWDWVNANHVEAPLHWRRTGGDWQQFTLAGQRPLDPATPVCHASLFEADAYARWADARLPTEAEWEVAATNLPAQGHFVEDGVLRPMPAVDHGTALAQLFGDVWEWTQSAYAPYPGFRPSAGAVGEYNGKFMSNQYVLRGGSFATPRSHIRATYRNFFPAPARWQFSGFRLARNV